MSYCRHTVSICCALVASFLLVTATAAVLPARPLVLFKLDYACVMYMDSRSVRVRVRVTVRLSE